MKLQELALQSLILLSFKKKKKKFSFAREKYTIQSNIFPFSLQERHHIKIITKEYLSILK